MVFWVWLFVPLVVGLAFGFYIFKRVAKLNCVGTLREDHSDPTEAPYLFLELEPGGLEKIHQNDMVCLRVQIENYIPRR